MPAVTISGGYGAGDPELGQAVAQLLEADYVDRQILVEMARHCRAAVVAVAGRDERVPSIA